MKKFKTLVAMVFAMLSMLGVASSCDKSSDEPGSSSSHDYYSAYVSGDPDYYWVIDMDHNSGPGYDGTFTIKAWNTDGKQMSGKNSYSGKYQIKNSNVYVTWNHQSMNTMWSISSSYIVMTGSSNPSELTGYTYYAGAPNFN